MALYKKDGKKTAMWNKENIKEEREKKEDKEPGVWNKNRWKEWHTKKEEKKREYEIGRR